MFFFRTLSVRCVEMQFYCLLLKRLFNIGYKFRRHNSFVPFNVTMNIIFQQNTWISRKMNLLVFADIFSRINHICQLFFCHSTYYYIDKNIGNYQYLIPVEQFISMEIFIAFESISTHSKYIYIYIYLYICTYTIDVPVCFLGKTMLFQIR